jgi:hypothetical protein
MGIDFSAELHSRKKRDEETRIYSAVGDISVLPCNATVPPVIWIRVQKTTPTGDSQVIEHIAEHGIVLNGYKTKFSLDITPAGIQNLVIQNTSKSDGGKYECTVDGGLGSKHYVYLIVTGE